jgi:6-phospho-beta-glucosidase
VINTKIALIGAGSSYTPELADGLIRSYPELPVDQIALMDTDAERLQILTDLTRRMFAKAGVPILVTATQDRRAAIADAAFVCTLIRVGGMSARIQDERIPLKYGIIGQETTGPGGFAKALRTIPVMLDIARDTAEVAPGAWIINYTNPSGLITEAVTSFSEAKIVGLCSGPYAWTNAVLRAMSVSPERANVDWVGLNHLGWITRVLVDGQDRTEEAIEAAIASGWSIEGELMRALRAIPCSYLGYYYHRERALERARTSPQTRGEQVQAIEGELMRLYADPLLAEKPALLKQRGGGGYSDVATAAMRAIYHNRQERQVVNTPNLGAIRGLPVGAVAEIPCIVDRAGPHPIMVGDLPPSLCGLVSAVKAYEQLTVRAAVSGDYRLALQALLAHPLVPSYETAVPLLDELLAAHRAYLPRFSSAKSGGATSLCRGDHES